MGAPDFWGNGSRYHSWLVKYHSAEEQCMSVNGLYTLYTSLLTFYLIIMLFRLWNIHMTDDDHDVDWSWCRLIMMFYSPTILVSKTILISDISLSKGEWLFFNYWMASNYSSIIISFSLIISSLSFHLVLISFIFSSIITSVHYLSYQ